MVLIACEVDTAVVCVVVVGIAVVCAVVVVGIAVICVVVVAATSAVTFAPAEELNRGMIPMLTDLFAVVVVFGTAANVGSAIVGTAIVVCIINVVLLAVAVAVVFPMATGTAVLVEPDVIEVEVVFGATMVGVFGDAVVRTDVIEVEFVNGTMVVSDVVLGTLISTVTATVAPAG